MRYAQRGGYTPAEQQRRELLRMEAAGRFARGDTISQIAHEGTWSLLKRSMANFAAADQVGLVRIIKGKLKKIQYRLHLIDGCLAATGLTIEPW
jgi:hypothetical protein